MAADFDTDATTAALVTAGQQGSLFVVRHVNHPHLLRDSAIHRNPFDQSVNSGPVDRTTTLTIYPIRVSGKDGARPLFLVDA